MINNSSFIFTDFSLINSIGHTVGAGFYGLLLSNGGTVCGDNFDDNSADAVCREMGHSGHAEWTSGSYFPIQSDLEIKLDEVRCSSSEWDSCTFTFSHDCDHNNDVFLECYRIGKQF